ncbi:hypothetical protein FRZ44_38240 [Hypericibacter terrae]|uniref:GcrA cell cycle regulator n=1 Tax=Hypericibacter terrae TaxID=2602015 RepID=A0A5J6MMX9_9PROT|nr:GcrA family cell cycle regulator [Hypericibacter terrae]QEX18517.1 hypothetical protein FRZ44_38240 [Hypericibacter terrae]
MGNESELWTEARMELLRRLWGQRYTASQIAATMGVTRNQVIGKAHRMGLASRPSPIIRAPAAGVIPPRAAPKPCPPDPEGHRGMIPPPDRDPDAAWNGPTSPPPLPRAPIPVRAEAPKPMPAALVEGRGRWRPLIEAGPRDCRWPQGDLREGTLRFCCAGTELGHVYCAEHETAARGRGLASLERYDPEAKAA